MPLAAISLFSSAIFIWLSDCEHRLSSRPSDIFSIFLFVSISLDIIRIYSLWIIDGTRTVAILSTVTEVIKLGILVLESWSKRRALTPPYAAYPRRLFLASSVGCCFCGSTRWCGWDTKIRWLWICCLSLNPNSARSTYRNIPSQTGRMVCHRLSRSWRNNWHSNLVNQKKPYALLYYICWTNKWTILAGVIPRLCLIVFTFSQPFLLARVIDHENDPNVSGASRTWDVIAYVVVYTGIAVSKRQHMSSICPFKISVDVILDVDGWLFKFHNSIYCTNPGKPRVSAVR